MGTRAEIPFDVEIANTIFVSKNGDDSTGQRGNWNLPFLTIQSASAVAQAQDVVYVYAGTYSVGNDDWVKSDVHYYFEPNAKVTGLRHAVYDFGQDRNIWIHGEGTFIQTQLDFTKASVVVHGTNTNLYFRGYEMDGRTNGLEIRNATYDIKVNKINCNDQYPVGIYDNSDGILEWTDEIFTLSTGVAIQMRALGTDGQPHHHKIIGGKIRSNTQFAGSGQISQILNQPQIKVEYHNIEFDHFGGGTSSLIYLWNSGNAYFKNCYGVSQNTTAVNGFSGFGTVLIEGCNLLGENIGLLNTSDTMNINAKDSTFITNSDSDGAGGGSAMSGGEMTLENCELVQNSSFPNRKIFNIVGGILRLRNCKLVSNVALESIGNSGGAPRTIYIEGQSVTNSPVSPLITNGIAGTNIIVDPNVSRNSTNYFNI
jgi:hypothetical protein